MNLHLRIAACFLILLVTICCNRVEMLNEALPGIPAEASKIVTSKYSDATNLVAASLIGQKIWEVNFKLQNERYLSVVTTTEELVNMRSLKQVVPDSLSKLLIGLGLGPGSLSNFRQEQHTSEPASLQYVADYDWNGGLYTVYWTLDQQGLGETQIFIAPRFRFHFYSGKVSELPDTVQAFIKSKYMPAGTLTAVYVGNNNPEIFVVGDAPSHFGLYASMIINSEGRLLYSKMGKHEYVPQASLPENIQLYLRDKVAASLTSRGGTWQSFRFEDKGFGGYKVILRQSTGHPVVETYLYFDLEGRLLWQHYYSRAY